MINQAQISASLARLDVLFQAATGPDDPQFYCKLALLELGGWTEVTMDEIILKLCSRLLKEQANIDYIKKQVVKRTHGFEYNQHFREMLIRLIGKSGVEIVESRFDPGKFAPLVSLLATLKQERDPHAHQDLASAGISTTTTLEAPSKVIQKLAIVHAGLEDIDNVLGAIKVPPLNI